MVPKSLIVVCPQCDTDWVIEFAQIVKCLKCGLEFKVNEKGEPVLSEEEREKIRSRIQEAERKENETPHGEENPLKHPRSVSRTKLMLGCVLSVVVAAGSFLVFESLTFSFLLAVFLILIVAVLFK